MARETLIDTYGIDKGGNLRAEDLVIVPVKYDYEELKRWTLILKRFSVSPGNTIGLRNAEVAGTVSRYPEGTIFPNGLEVASLGNEGSRYTKMRMTIMVGSYDPAEFVEVMPDLLAQLGIPEDAVDIMLQGNRVLTEEDFEKVVLAPTGVEAFALDADFEAGLVL